MIRVVPVALLLMVMLAGSVAAECAWVMWIQSDGSLVEGTAYSTVSAWGTKRECEQKLTEKFAADVKSWGDKYRVTADEISGAPRFFAISKEKPDLIAVSRYSCLPDSVDPRGPKGK
jgi:hypothetical protein